LDEKTKKPEMSIHYEFNRAFGIDDYDPETGDFKKTGDIHSELIVFLDILKAAKIGLSNSIAHSMRVVNRFYNERIANDISEIANKLGVSTSSKPGFSRRRDIFAPGGENESSTIQSDDSANVESLNNINEIDQFLN
jgi:hypothetical protein